MKSCRHKTYDGNLVAIRHTGLLSSTGSELEAVISSGVVEEFSGKAKLTGRKAYGLRTPQGLEIALFHLKTSGFYVNQQTMTGRV